MNAITTPAPVVTCPEQDGNPISDNTLQFRWITTLQGGLDDPDVFVTGDLLWYPIQGDNGIRLAPNAMVVFGRPMGDRVAPSEADRQRADAIERELERLKANFRAAGLDPDAVTPGLGRRHVA